MNGLTPYKLPLVYPDWSLGPVLYLQRIKASLFYDYAYGEQSGSINHYNSTGIDITGDMYILRFLAPVELGLRYIYFPDQNTYKLQFLFGINLDSFYLDAVKPKT